MDELKIGVISLGCDKNRVDTEKMLALVKRNYQLTAKVEEADAVIINTCAFLESSRREAIEEILCAIDLKEQGVIRKIIVTGCLPQKFIGEIFNEFKEVDGFVGVADYENINVLIERVFQGERVNLVGEPRRDCLKERVKTTDHYAYLKIADGCSNHCTYCLIPKIRGGYRSTEMQALVDEVKALGDIKELILVAQDVTKYGEDLQPKSSLVNLIRALSALKNVGGIRLLYCYPESITDELIHEMAVNAKMIRYMDIPFQHADDKVLRRMNRKGTGEGYVSLVQKLRERVRGIAIRSTFIAGFPGETEENFNNLLEFIQKAKLDNAGFFAYSKEEGTASYLLDGHLKKSEKTKRVKKLYQAQKKVVKELNKQKIGKTFKVLAEGFDENMIMYYGRAYFSAPEIDGKIYFFSGEEVVLGEYINVKITDFKDYDLYGERI